MKNITDSPTWNSASKSITGTRLKDNTSCDVIIIGGGITGILTAYLLTKEKKKVILIEKEKHLLQGATSVTTAHITQVIDTDLSDCIKIYGPSKTKLLWESHNKAIDLIDSIVKKENIDCEFTRCSWHAYANTEEDFEYLKSEHQTAQKLGFKTSLSQKNNFIFRNFGHLEVKNQAKFHPTKFCSALAQKIIETGGVILTGTEITEYSATKKQVAVQIGKNTITAENIIISTYKPIKLLKTFAKKGPYRTYVFEIEIDNNIIPDGLYEDTENPYHYFRVDNDCNGKARVILGGEDHRQELNKALTDKSFAALEEYWQTIMGKHPYRITKRWYGQILEPSDGLALIGEGKPRQYVATGFSGNGMTYGAIAAMIFNDSILGRKNPWVKLYDPARIPTAKQLGYKARDYGEEFVRGALKNMIK